VSFKLPPLPYAYDALAPYMSKETLEFHHDKHHQAYVDNGGKAIAGTPYESLSLTTPASTTTTSTSGSG
jgi:Fe-Mn family superoxide dismutase